MIRKIVKQGTEEKDKVRNEIIDLLLFNFNVLLAQLGRTLLHYAAHHGNCDVVDLFLDNNADVDALDKVSTRIR